MRTTKYPAREDFRHADHHPEIGERVHADTHWARAKKNSPTNVITLMTFACFIVESETSYRWYAWGVILLTVGGIAWMESRFGRRWASRWRRGIEVLLLLAATGAGMCLAFADVINFEGILQEHWREFREPNMLNRMARYGDRNPTIQVPHDRAGVIHSGPFGTDLHVEIDAHGRLSIHNARMNSTILRQIIKARIARIGPFRTFLWCDERSPRDRQDQIVQLLGEAGCREIYFVVRTQDTPNMTYAAIPVHRGKTE